MENLKYLENMGWRTWSTPYSRDRKITSVKALEIINQTVDFLGRGRKVTAVTRSRVVVVGEQGCGKSSVLESFIGTGFLPKCIAFNGNAKHGSGGAEVENRLKTSCPVIINLVNSPLVEGTRHTSWIEFSHHHPKRQILDLDEVEKEIEERMEYLSSRSTYGVSEIEIVLTYYSSEVVNMTLIDLPGFELVNDEILQACERDANIQRLVLKYIQQPDIVILAVTPVQSYTLNASSPIMNFVKKIDPNERRSLIVLSHWDKLANISRGRKIVLGQSMKMDLGLVAIQNRTEEEVMKKTSVQNSQVEAEHYILNHYRGLTTVLTARYLVERVCELIILLWGSRLHEQPTLKNRILIMINAMIVKRMELAAMEDFPRINELEQTIENLQFVAAVIDKWKDFGIEGSVTKHKQLREQFLVQ